MEGHELADIRRRLDGLERRLAQLEGGGAPRAARSDLSRLSETERRITALVIAGHTNEEVAQRLFLSPKTVEWSLTKIYRKLLVRSRTELAAKLAPAGSFWGNAGETPGLTLSGSASEAQSEDGGETSRGQIRRFGRLIGGGPASSVGAIATVSSNAETRPNQGGIT